MHVYLEIALDIAATNFPAHYRGGTLLGVVLDADQERWMAFFFPPSFSLRIYFTWGFIFPPATVLLNLTSTPVKHATGPRPAWLQRLSPLLSSLRLPPPSLLPSLPRRLRLFVLVGHRLPVSRGQFNSQLPRGRRDLLALKKPRA